MKIQAAHEQSSLVSRWKINLGDPASGSILAALPSGLTKWRAHHGIRPFRQFLDANLVILTGDKHLVMQKTNTTPPKHILVFIPGFMGSQLRSRSTGEVVWLDVPSLVRDPIRLQARLHSNLQQLMYPNDDLVADRILDQILFLPPLSNRKSTAVLSAL